MNNGNENVNINQNNINMPNNNIENLNSNSVNMPNNSMLNNGIENLNQNNLTNNNLNYGNSQIQSGNNLNNTGNNIPNKFKNIFQNKYLLYIIGALFLVAVIVFIGYKFFFSRDSSVEVIFAEDALIKVKKNEKYGYINTNGKFVLDPIYEEASSFQGDYAVVTIKENDSYSYQIIDKKGNVKVKTNIANGIKHDAEHGTWLVEQVLYSDSLKKLSKDNVKVDDAKYGYFRWIDTENKTAGLMNYKGKIIYTYKFQNSEDYFSVTPSEIDSVFSERYCIANVENERYAIINCDTGKIIYDYTDKYISDDDNNIFTIRDQSIRKTLNTIYIQNDKIAYQSNSSDVHLKFYPPKTLEISDYSKSGSERYSYFDITTGQISKDAPVSGSITDNLDAWEKLTGITKKSCSNNGYGLVSGDKEILACGWDDIDYFGVLLYQYLSSKGKEYVMAEKNNKTYIVNLKNGKTVAEFNASYIYDDELSTFIYYDDNSTNKRVVYNLLTGKEMTIDKQNDLDTYSNYITVEEGNKINYYNNNLKLIYTE